MEGELQFASTCTFNTHIQRMLFERHKVSPALTVVQNRVALLSSNHPPVLRDMSYFIENVSCEEAGVQCA